MRNTILFTIALWACFQSLAKEISNENGTLKINYEATDTVYSLDIRKVLISVNAPDQYKDLVVKINGRELNSKTLGNYEYTSKEFASGIVEEEMHSCKVVVTAIDAKGAFVQINHTDQFYVKPYEVSYKPEVRTGYGIGMVTQAENKLGYMTKPNRRFFNLLIKFSETEKVLIRPEKLVKEQDSYVYFKIPKLKGIGTAYLVDDDTAVLEGSYRDIVILDDSAPKVRLKIGNKMTPATALTTTDLSMLTMDCKFSVADNNVVVNYEVYKNGKLLIASKNRGGSMGKGLDFVRNSHKAFAKGDKLILWGDGIQFRLPEKQEITEGESEDEYKERIVYNLSAPFKFEISVK